MSVHFIPEEIVLIIHTDLLQRYGGSAGLRDRNLLESAIAQPKITVGGKYAHKTIFDKAAAYGFHVCMNHPFVDGNKRTALAACLVFLEVNGLLSKRKLPLAAWESLVLDVAASRLDRNQTTRRLRKLLPRARH